MVAFSSFYPLTMKKPLDYRFTHRCRACGYRWFTHHPCARCLKCGSAYRDTFKLVPCLRERNVHRELAAYCLVALGAIITLLLRI